MILGQIRSLLQAVEEGDVFQQHYYAALQDVPEVVMAHGEVSKILRS